MRAIRKQVGMTQAEFADVLNVTAAYVSHLECDKRPVSRRVELELQVLGWLLRASARRK